MDNYVALRQQYEKFILDPNNKDVLMLLKAVRNGIVYGAKIRFPHALVMIFLFRSGTFREKATAVFKATRQHASNLARFALIYKSMQLGLSKFTGGKREPIHSFLAGAMGGYWVFGHGKAATNGVTQQIVIYIFARVALAAAKLAVQTAKDTTLVGSKYGHGTNTNLLGLQPAQAELLRNNTWPVFAALSWASVMWFFENHPETLQPSLRSSMVYIYANAEKWDNARNFLWHNV